MKKSILGLIGILFCLQVLAQETSHDAFITKNLDANTERFSKAAREIWENPELGFLEFTSSKVLIDELKASGFKVETGVAGMPTAFVATYDKGGPVIGFLAEYDALPGLSQDAVPYRSVIVEGGNGHGCGHNLFGTAVVASGVALKDWIDANNIKATIKIFGTPAEESGGGKVYMARDGIFNGVDAVINWHPSDRNAANASSCNAVIGGRFKFHGETAHAAASPQRGRSALDAVEAMNMMVNMMREHVDQESRIHYIISSGGMAPNVVPDYAEVQYMIRHPDIVELKDMWARIGKAAEGAAMGTGTRVDIELASGLYGLLPNETLAKVMHKNLSLLGGVEYNQEEIEFAREIQKTFNAKNIPPIESAKNVEPYSVNFFPASTDVGDVSYVVPTVGLGTATWVPGTAAHTWQAVAADGMSIGYKGMMLAAKTMALTGKDLILNPLIIKEATKEFKERMGDLKYEALVGDKQVPLDYNIKN
jgi:aminobenzoyl-glutamate utilization protein B